MRVMHGLAKRISLAPFIALDISTSSCPHRHIMQDLASHSRGCSTRSILYPSQKLSSYTSPTDFHLQYVFAGSAEYALGHADFVQLSFFLCPWNALFGNARGGITRLLIVTIASTAWEHQRTLTDRSNSRDLVTSLLPGSKRRQSCSHT